MPNPSHRPKVLPDSTEVKASVPREIAEAIDALADASGASRAAFLRSVIFAGLQPFAVTDPDLAAKLPATVYNKAVA